MSVVKYLIPIILVSLVAKAENKSFELAFNKMGYLDNLFALVKETCDKENKDKKIDCSKKSISVFKSTRKKMEEDFLKKFTKEELAYLEKLFSHQLMQRLYDFNLSFVTDAKLKSEIVAELKSK